MRALISGGGTGGHLFPAIAVAQALLRSDPDTAVLYVGRRGAIEERVVPRHGIRFEAIPAMPIDTDQLWRNWRLAAVAPAAVWQALRLIRGFRPDVVLGTGGYVSAPVVMAARLARVPIVLQEQNLVPGRTTRLLARFARCVAIAYPESSRYLDGRSVLTGTPVRSDFRRRTDFPNTPRRLLVLGGSQGAHRINLAVAEALPALLERADLTLVHQTGARDLVAMQAARVKLPSAARDRYRPIAFSEDVAGMVEASDLVLSRAGASTLSEVGAVGVPMILVPYPFAGGHQRLNVAPFVEAGAALLIPDAECDGERLTTLLTSLLDDEHRYQALVAGMASLPRPQAAEAVAAILRQVARG